MNWPVRLKNPSLHSQYWCFILTDMLMNIAFFHINDRVIEIRMNLAKKIFLRLNFFLEAGISRTRYSTWAPIFWQTNGIDSIHDYFKQENVNGDSFLYCANGEWMLMMEVPPSSYNEISMVDVTCILWINILPVWSNILQSRKDIYTIFFFSISLKYSHVKRPGKQR